MSGAAVLAGAGTLAIYSGWRLMCVADTDWGLFAACCVYLGAVFLLIAALAAFSP
jgi:hypothetical protein